jgi:hypothetical protein
MSHRTSPGRRRVLAVLATTTGVCLAFPLVPAEAQPVAQRRAELTIRSVKVNPNPVPIYAGRTEVTVDVRLTSTTPVEDAGAGLTAATGQKAYITEPVLVSGTRTDGVWRSRGYFDRKSDPGKWYLYYSALSSDQYLENWSAASFLVRRQTRLTSVKIGPNRVRSGSAITVSGRLWRLTPKGPDDFAPYARGTVNIVFKRRGTKTWKSAGTARTDSSGRFTRRIKPTKDGTWAVFFPGTLNEQPVLSATQVYVDVR